MVAIQITVTSHYKDAVTNKKEAFNKMVVNIVNIYLKQNKNYNIIAIENRK